MSNVFKGRRIVNNECDIFSETECPVTYALRMIGGKWHLPVLGMLFKNPVMRYNALKREVRGITNMMLTQTLKDLEHHGLISRTQYSEIPPRVEYSLTQAGWALGPVIQALGEWGQIQLSAKGEK